MTSHPPASVRRFHGWWVVAAAFSVMFLGFGSAYTFSAFIAALQQEFHASRGSVSMVFSLAGFLYFGLGVLSGPLADRWGARRLAVAGMLLTGAGMVLASVARSLTEVSLAYGLGVGLGIGCSYVPAVAVVQRWFLRRRGFASGLAVSGIGVGTLLMPSVAAWLIDAIGWRWAYAAIGATVAIVGTIMASLIVDDPSEHGVAPDGDSAVPQHVSAPRTGTRLRDAVRSRPFIVLYAACLICGFGVFVPFVHLVPYAVAHGSTLSSAVLLLGVIGVGSTAGRFFLGGLADRIGRPAALSGAFGGMALSLVVWASSTSLPALMTFAFMYGVFYGGWVAVLPSVVMDQFGGRHLSSIIGALYTSVAFGTLIGPSAVGYAFDASGSYLVPIIACVALNIVAAAIVRISFSRPDRPD